MSLTEEEIRKLTLAAIEELGESATPEAVKKIVAKSIEKMDTSPDEIPKGEYKSGRIILRHLE